MSKNTSSLLINEPPLQVLPSLATRIGINAAIVLQQVHYWTEHYRVVEENLPSSHQLHFKQGHWWVYNSYKEWQETNFPFWSQSTIKRAVRDLVKLGLLKTEQFDKNSYERQNWYSIDYDKLNKLDANIEATEGNPEEMGEPVDKIKMTPSTVPGNPVGNGQVDPFLNKNLTETTQREEEEVNDGCAIGGAAQDMLVIDPDLADTVALFERTGRELTPDVLERFSQMAGRCDSAARADGESGGQWLKYALEQALGRARPESVLNYADKVIGGWLERGYRKRRRSRSPGEELSPELAVFHRATGRLPLPDQRNLVVSLIHQRQFTSDELRPFWEAWVGRDKRRSDLTWLTAWALSGEIPPAISGKPRTKSSARQAKSSAVENYLRKRTQGDG